MTQLYKATDQIVIDTYKEAIRSQQNAYAPYSKFHVGAAFYTKSKKIIAGCNVENASFGATVCAERAAVQNSISINGEHSFEFLVVVTNTDPAIGPCGLCLQVLSEFVTSDFPIFLANSKGIQSQVTFNDLLGRPFSEIPKQSS